MKNYKICNTLILVVLFLSACSGGSDSGGAVENSVAGDMIPANFVGTYTGSITVTASASGLSETDSFPITIVVSANGDLRFEGDDPDETFTVGLTNSGQFSGSLDIAQDDCSGTVSVQGTVDGSRATGPVSGTGECTVSGLNVDVDLEGSFEATK